MTSSPPPWPTQAPPRRLPNRSRSRRRSDLTTHVTGPARLAAGPAIVLLLCLTGCAAPASNGSWVGPVTPRQPGPACEPTRGLAQVSGDRLTFTPNQGTWLLVGTVEADGRLSAERIQQGANKQPFETRLEGRRTGDTLTGTYTTPRCTFDVTLTRR